MGQLGFQELILIFLIALLVFGPKKLPELGKSLGKGLREFKRATNDLKSSWDEQMRDVEKETSDIKNTVSQTQREMQQELNKTYEAPSIDPRQNSGPDQAAQDQPKEEAHQA